MTLQLRQQIKAENYQRTIDLFHEVNGNLSCPELAERLGLKDHTVRQYLSEYFKEKNFNKR